MENETLKSILDEEDIQLIGEADPAYLELPLKIDVAELEELRRDPYARK